MQPPGAPQLLGAGPPPAPPAKPASMTGSTGGEGGPGLVSTGSVGPDEAPSALQALQEKYSAWQQRLDAAVAQARPDIPPIPHSLMHAGYHSGCHMLSSGDLLCAPALAKQYCSRCVLAGGCHGELSAPERYSYCATGP